MYLLLCRHHQNDCCITKGGNESHFNVSLIVRDKVTRQCPKTTTSEEKGEPKRIRTEVPLPLGQTGLRFYWVGVRPDITVTVDWALKSTCYLSFYWVRPDITVKVNWALKTTCYLSFYWVRIRHDITVTVNWALKTTYYLSFCWVRVRLDIIFMVGWALKTLVIYHSMSSSSPWYNRHGWPTGR